MQKSVVVGFEVWRSGAKGKAVLPYDIWLHVLVILYFTPTLVNRCNALPKKVSKVLYKKKYTETDKRRRHFFYTLFTGFNKHSMYEGVFPEYIEIVNPSVKVSEYIK